MYGCWCKSWWKDDLMSFDFDICFVFVEVCCCGEK